MRIKVHDKFFRPYISDAEIQAVINDVAQKINRDYINCEEPPIVLCVRNGAIIFTAELIQNLDFNIILSSVRAKSYSGTCSSGKVEITMDSELDVRGKKVLVCEDLIDTGLTMMELKKYLLEECGAAEVKIAVMLLKPGKMVCGEYPDYCGMEINDEFIVGHGLDYDGLGRNYKDIYILDE